MYDLFCLDPRRTAILLLGRTKAGRWDESHRQSIPQADRLYEVYLEELKKEGLLRLVTPSGANSETASTPSGLAWPNG
jgi:hypothetical protein